MEPHLECSWCGQRLEYDAPHLRMVEVPDQEAGAPMICHGMAILKGAPTHGVPPVREAPPENPER